MESKIARQNRKRALASEFAEFLRECPTRLSLAKTNVRSSFENTSIFVFDFDKTLTPAHIYELVRLFKSEFTFEDLSKPPFVDPLFNESVGELFKFLREQGKTIYIASRNYQDIIFKYIRANFDPEFPLENIYSDRGSYFSESLFGGKGKSRVFQDNAHRLHELIYIDDTLGDIEEFTRRYEGLQYHHKDYFEPISVDKIQQIFSGALEETRGFVNLGPSPSH